SLPPPEPYSSCLWLICSCYIGRTNALECQPESGALVDNAPQFLGQRDAGVSRRERRQLGEAFGDLASSGKELVGSDDLVDGAPFLGRLRIELLAGEDEIAAAYRANRFLPHEMDAITRRDAEI